MAFLIAPRGLGDGDHGSDDRDPSGDCEQLAPRQGSRVAPDTPGGSHIYELRLVDPVLKRTATELSPRFRIS